MFFLGGCAEGVFDASYEITSVFKVPTANIAIDNDLTDWDNVSPKFQEKDNNDISNNNMDIKTVLLAKDSNYVYIMCEFEDHLSTEASIFFYFSVPFGQLPDNAYDNYTLSLYYDTYESHWIGGVNHDWGIENGDNTSQPIYDFIPGEDYGFAANGSPRLELRAPLNIFGGKTEFDFVAVISSSGEYNNLDNSIQRTVSLE